MPSFTLGQIAQQIGGSVVGAADTVITGVAPLKSAQAGQIAFLASNKPKLLADLAVSNASGIVVRDPALAPGRNLIVVANAVEAFDTVLGLFPTPQCPPDGIHPAAFVDPSAKLAEGVAVGPGAVIQAGCEVGPRTVIWPNVFVGRDCRIGSDCTLHPGVVLREQTELGDRVIIHPNAVLGADGFGYRTTRQGVHVKVPQVGRVVVGNDVEIGANTTIDRAKFGATRIGSGSKIDNICQIAHNVQIGEHCLIMGMVGIAGSAELEHHVMMAGRAGIVDNVTLGAGTIVTACSCAAQDAAPGSVLGGWIAQDHRANMRQMILTRRLPELFERVNKLAERLEAIDGAAADNQ